MNKEILTIVFDNRTVRDDLKTGWGFACLVDFAGRRFLFDTGNDSRKTAFNLERLGIDPKGIDAIILSHAHWDHTGGLSAILDHGRAISVYCPGDFPGSFRRRLHSRGVEFEPVKEVVSLAEGVYAGPCMRRFGPSEIPLVIETKRGLVVITGCAHPGIIRMLKEIKTVFGRHIDLVAGGFHWAFSMGLEKKAKQLKRIEVGRAAPCHCTGEKAMGWIRRQYGGNYVEAAAGSVIPLGEIKAVP